ncbi:hypothetical protein Tco_1164691 [Tanacetum coccineum]
MTGFHNHYLDEDRKRHQKEIRNSKLDVMPSADFKALLIGTSINVQKEQSLDLSAGTLCNVNKENLRVWLLKKLISQKPLSTWIHR